MIQTSTAKGLRPYQEDRFITCSHPDGDLLAVFDGHGGDNCCTYLDEHFVGKFTTVYDETLEGLAEDEDMVGQKLVKAWRLFMRTVFKKTFRALAKETENMRDGSTASVVWIPRRSVQNWQTRGAVVGAPLYNGKPMSAIAHQMRNAASAINAEAVVAIVGDSPVIIGGKGKNFHRSPEHNARTNKKECEAAEKRGAFYSGGYLCRNWNGPGLQMSRALGDCNLPFLSRLPEIYFKSVNDFILVASDGIMDPGHTGEGSIPDMVNAIRTGATADQLVKTAVAMPTHDNVTAILWRL